MEDNQTQPGVRVNEQLWKEFRQDVRDRHGRVKGHVGTELERAIREYINASKGGDTHDRLRRIEQRLDELAENQASGSEQSSDGRTDSVSKTTENRISEIMDDIRDRADELDTKRVRESDVEAAIERNAGTSYKTIQRYKSLLQNQKEMFPHPMNEGVYFVNPQSFIAFVEQNDQIGEATRNRLADEYSWSWWEDNAPSGLIQDEGRGFQ